MMKYGGIYLDNDVFVIRSLHKFRKYELALGWPQNESMGTQASLKHFQLNFNGAFQQFVVIL
jgi:mannosyltransferase OCH1-like enzyme